MSLPINALSDEELEGYAGVEPEAAAELARRIASGCFARESRVTELEGELAEASNAADEAEGDLERLRNAAELALDLIQECVSDELSAEDREASLKKAAKHLEDAL